MKNFSLNLAQRENKQLKLIMNDPVAPILRWAGGKRWLIKHLSSLLPPNGFNNYHEPFIGGGAIFLAINPGGVSYLSDLNKELIATYRTVQKRPEEIIRALKCFQNTEKFYYKIRDAVFDDEVCAAARFIFLNQTSFNGLYRVNLNGQYNVPYGFRSKDFIDEGNIRLVSKRLKRARLYNRDFEKMKRYIRRNDLVFLDPPYTVAHNCNGFIKYNKKLFSLDDQIRLGQFIEQIKVAGAKYILTNAYHETIKDIFDKGDRVLFKNRANLIGGSNAVRGQTTEYIFTNIQL